MKKFLSWFLIIQALSLLTVSAYAYYVTQAPTQLEFTNYQATSIAKTLSSNGQMPTRIAIPDLGIDLPVYQATIIHNVWPTTTKGASYLTSSPVPGNTGNSVIYAHNWESLFGHLRYAKVGEKVIVTYPDKTKKTFVIAYTSIVTPDTSSILSSSKDKRLTLYTCIGFFDSHRFVAVALLKS